MGGAGPKILRPVMTGHHTKFSNCSYNSQRKEIVGMKNFGAPLP